LIPSRLAAPFSQRVSHPADLPPFTDQVPFREKEKLLSRTMAPFFLPPSRSVFLSKASVFLCFLQLNVSFAPTTPSRCWFFSLFLQTFLREHFPFDPPVFAVSAFSRADKAGVTFFLRTFLFLFLKTELFRRHTFH